MSCIEKFKENCKNLDVKCHECKANLNTSSSKFYYVPLCKNKGLTKKDFELILKPNKSTKNYSRLGRKIESKVIKNIGGKLTANSGATFGDGDGYLTINDRRYYIEHKTRFNGKSLYGLSKAEMTKAIAQGNELFIVTDNQNGNSYISMNINTFIEITTENDQIEN